MKLIFFIKVDTRITLVITPIKQIILTHYFKFDEKTLIQYKRFN